MNLREKVGRITLPEGQTRHVIDVVELLNYLKEMFAAKLDKTYIADKLFQESNEAVYEYAQTLKEPKEEEAPSPAPTKKKKAKAKPIPEPEEEEDDSEEAEVVNESDDNEEAEADEITRLKAVEKELFS